MCNTWHKISKTSVQMIPQKYQTFQVVGNLKFENYLMHLNVVFKCQAIWEFTIETQDTIQTHFVKVGSFLVIPKKTLDRSRAREIKNEAIEVGADIKLIGLLSTST